MIVTDNQSCNRGCVQTNGKPIAFDAGGSEGGMGISLYLGKVLLA